MGQELIDELSATIGCMMNAKIALECGDTKRSVGALLERGILRARAALAKAGSGGEER